MNEIIKQISLEKGEDRYIFRYNPGKESDVVDIFAEYATDPKRSFDWFDAAVLSYQMGRKIMEDSEKYF